MTGSTARCPACRAEVAEDDAFCGVCGTPLDADPYDGLIGKVIDDRFRIVRLLGSGGMGSIYLAEHVGIGKQVAIKLLRADLRGHPHLVKRFRQEAMAVSRLTDAHTITVFDFGIWEGVVYLVMEYLTGEDLSKLLERRRRLEPRRALLIAHQVCSSLAEAHARGVIHRDLKPENVFLTRTASGDEFVKVLDFGLAKILNPADGAEAMVQTADGALMGTPYYMAPEQVRGELVDGRTDLYALGALLFRMLTGDVPYRGKSPLQVMEAHVSGNLRRFVDVDHRIDVPPAVEALVRRLMSRDRGDRPDGALAVDDEIVKLVDRLPPSSLDGLDPLPASGSRTPDARGSASRGAPNDTVPSIDHLDASSPDEPEPPSADDERTPIEVPRGRASLPALTFDDGPSDKPRSGQPAEPDPSNRSWVLGATDPSARSLDFDGSPNRGRGGGALLATLLVLAALAGGGWYAYTHLLQTAPTVEQEPNDDAPSATLAVGGTPMTGAIGPPREGTADRDVFVLDRPSDRRVARVEVTGVEGLDLVLEGFDYDGGLLFRADQGRFGDGERAEVVVPTPRLLVAVRSAARRVNEVPAGAPERPYRLTVDFIAGSPAEAPPARGGAGIEPEGRGAVEGGGEGGQPAQPAGSDPE